MNCMRPSGLFILVVKDTLVNGLQLKIQVCFMSDKAIEINPPQVSASGSLK